MNALNITLVVPLLLPHGDEAEKFPGPNATVAALRTYKRHDVMREYRMKKSSQSIIGRKKNDIFI